VSVNSYGLLLLWQQLQASNLCTLQELLQAAIDLKPSAIWLSFGDWDSLATPIKKAGIIMICQVQHLEQVEPALKAGADVIVGQVLPQVHQSAAILSLVLLQMQQRSVSSACKLELPSDVLCDNRNNAHHSVS